MCVVIDASTFGEICDDNNKEFEPLRNWISGKGHKVIHGGSKYKEELLKHGKFLGYLAGLDRAGNPSHKLDTKKVDDTQVFLEQNFTSKAYNDHHIAAILFVSGCRVVSSHDQGLHQLIEECCSSNGSKIIKNGSKIIESVTNLMNNKPRIYQDSSHKSFLNNRSVSHCCV
jgi:hypothetical protein